MTDFEDPESWSIGKRLDDEDPVASWLSKIHTLQTRGRTAEAERLRQSGPPPAPGVDPRSFAPFVFATEVGGDPGGAIAVALAALREPMLGLVISIGDGEAVRFTRHLLDVLGRRDVVVVSSSGPPSGEPQSITGLVPSQVPLSSTNVLGAVRQVTASTAYLVRWANHGPLTDLAAVLADDQGLPDRLVATVAAGPLDGGSVPGRAFLGSDPAAAGAVVPMLRRPVQAACDPRAAARRMPLPALITADPGPLGIGPDSGLYHLFRTTNAPEWAVLLAAHLDRWFAHGHRVSSQYAALTIANAISVIFIDHEPEHVTVDSAGAVRIDPAGVEMRTSYAVKDAEFLDWLERQFRAASSGWTD